MRAVGLIAAATLVIGCGSGQSGPSVTQPTIATQPTAQTVISGQTATFTVVATAGNPATLNYQWQTSADGTTWNNVSGGSGANTASYTTAATMNGDNGKQFRVTVDNGAGQAVTSNAVALTVDWAPTIATQPTAQTVNSGQTATFTVVAASGNPATLNYQWQASADGTTWNNASGGCGANPASYITAATVNADNGKEFRVIVDNGAGQAVTSNAIALTVDWSPTIAAQPTAQAVNSGQTATFSAVAASGNPATLNYQWQVSADGTTWNNVSGGSGANTASYTTAGTVCGDNRKQFRVAVDNGAGQAMTSNAAKLTVRPCGGWTATASMNTPRQFFTATVLDDGTVLAAGGMNTGNSIVNTAEVYDPKQNSWTYTGNLHDGARANQKAALLSSGEVLIAAGFQSYPDCSYRSDAELYDPSSGTFSQTGSRGTNSDGWGGMTVLGDGRVIAEGGGIGCGLYTNYADIYDPLTGLWTPTTNTLPSWRDGLITTLLGSGKVVAAGGSDSSSSPSTVSYLFDPTVGSNGTWAATGPLNSARWYPNMVTLNSGSALIAGGVDSSNNPMASSELYDPSLATWSMTGAMKYARSQAASVVLQDGRVLVSGGYSGSAGDQSVAELYDETRWPSVVPCGTSGTWTTKTAPPAYIPALVGGVINNSIYVAGSGGASWMGSYDPNRDVWTPNTARGGGNVGETAAQAIGTDLYIVGGCGNNYDCADRLNSLWAYATTGDSWVPETALPYASEAAAVATLGGKLYIIGGADGPPTGGGASYYNATNTVNVYDPGSNSYSTAASIPVGYVFSAGAAIGDKIYVVGGTPDGSFMSSDLYIYDSVDNSWSQGPSMPGGGRLAMAVAVACGQLHVIGGNNSAGNVTTHEVYDPATDAWTTATPLPSTPTGGLVAAAMPNGLFVIDGGSGAAGIVYQYQSNLP